MQDRKACPAGRLAMKKDLKKHKQAELIAQRDD